MVVVLAPLCNSSATTGRGFALRIVSGRYTRGAVDLPSSGIRPGAYVTKRCVVIVSTYRPGPNWTSVDRRPSSVKPSLRSSLSAPSFAANASKVTFFDQDIRFGPVQQCGKQGCSHASPAPRLAHDDSEAAAMSDPVKTAVFEADAADNLRFRLGQQNDFAGVIPMLFNPRSLFVFGVWKLVGLQHERLGLLVEVGDARQECCHVGRLRCGSATSCPRRP